jgi:hypothetical protein
MTSEENERRKKLGVILRLGELRDQAEEADALTPAERDGRVCENEAAYRARLREIEAAE